MIIASGNGLSEKHHWNQITIGWFRLVVLPAVILLTPFLIFLDRFFYDLLDSGTIISLAIFIGASLFCSFLMFVGGRISHSIIVAVLITCFIDIQFEWIEGGSGLRQIYAWLVVALTIFIISWTLKENFFRIATVIFSVFFIVTLGQLVWGKPHSKISFSQQVLGVKAQSLPRIIHLVLDEHIGIEGIPIESEFGRQMKTDLMNFYQKNGFTAYGGAYSHFYSSLYSIPSFLNFSSGPMQSNGKQDDILFKGPEPYKLLRNRYFQLLFDRGHKINVLPNAMFIDYCSENIEMIEKCVEVPLLGMKLLKDSDLVVMDKLKLIFSHYKNMGYTYEGVKNLISKLLRVRPASRENRTKTRLPWDLNVKKTTAVSTLTSLLVLDDLPDKVLSLPQGHVLFSHVIFPHYPYITQRNCSLSPSLNQWKNIGGSYPEGQRNTFSSREERYRAYFQQMQCLYRQLDKLFEQMRKASIYNESIIIVQGDHGSRITRLEPFIENSARLSKQDLKDSFSTLFAVKFPGRQGHYNTSTRPIEDLLAETLFSDVKTLMQKVEKEPEPFVYLKKEMEFEKFPYINGVH